jgi:uncharacterized protein (DUF169 family)
MDYTDFSNRIGRMIRPLTHPLGVKILKEGETPPEKAPRPSKYGVKISLCQWSTMARRWGRAYAALPEDIHCSPCLAAMGMKKLDDPRILSDYFMEMGYFENPDLAEKAVQALNTAPPGHIRGLVTFPLENTPVAPDVVLIYGTPAQMARLVAGYVYFTGELVEFPATGFGISCLSAMRPYFTGKPALGLPGRGERILAGTEETEMFFTFPAANLPQLVDGLEKTHARGSRYPVQRYLIYEPPEIPPVKALGEKLTEI